MSAHIEVRLNKTEIAFLKTLLRRDTSNLARARHIVTKLDLARSLSGAGSEGETNRPEGGTT